MSNTFETEELVTIDAILALPPFRNIDRLTFSRLRRRGVFPYVELGHKTYLYNPAQLLAALEARQHPASQ